MQALYKNKYKNNCTTYNLTSLNLNVYEYKHGHLTWILTVLRTSNPLTGLSLVAENLKRLKRKIFLLRKRINELPNLILRFWEETKATTMSQSS